MPIYDDNESVFEAEERAYHERMAELLERKKQLMNGTLPAYVKKEKKLEKLYRERLGNIECWRTYMILRSEVRLARETAQLRKEFKEEEEAIWAESEEERKRSNDPVPAQERGNNSEIEEDSALTNGRNPIFETKIEDGKLLDDKKW